MIEVSLGAPADPNDVRWVIASLREIERASRIGGDTIADGFTIVGTLTETRTLDVDTPTVANIAAVLATLLTDMKRRGQKRKRG
jgi:hypothetical protein